MTQVPSVSYGYNTYTEIYFNMKYNSIEIIYD